MFSANTVPVYIAAKTKDELVAAMLKNNQTYGISFKYFSISFAGGEWVAWFRVDAGTVISGKLAKSASESKDGR